MATDQRHPGDRGTRRRPPRMRTGARGFTLIEILIVVVILGILAAIVIPQFSNASHVARENSLKDDLRYLRTQVVVFKAQHRDTAPGYPNGNAKAVPTEADFSDQMTKYTSDRCATSATSAAGYPLGPYVLKMPANPLNNATKVKVIPNGSPMPTTYQGTEFGWIYKPETQEIAANSDQVDSNGQPYIQY